MDPPGFANLEERFTVRGQKAEFVRLADSVELDSFCKKSNTPTRRARITRGARRQGRLHYHSLKQSYVAVGVRADADGRQQPETGLRFAFERGARSARRFNSP
jgi:hypothetical protein